ncbi:voltage-dependent calcium channel gamma-5 subunit-like [Mytilus edulis]|uniref:voltage-dependent calcium channel gamma-5 subunit-like n=1 Tax=Mytilus edulis TaxID=6550 RepID=UPI0039F0C1E8
MHCSKFMLACVAFSLGAVSLASIALAISTDYWLMLSEEVTTESMLSISEITVMKEMNYSMPETIEIASKIGLWRFCIIYAEGKACTPLDYTSSLKKKDKNDKQETTTAIAEAQRAATPVFLTGFFLVICSTLFNIVGNIRGNVLTLLAAVFYINAGLCIAVGMVLYITFINDETSHAKKSEDLAFSYEYSWSTYLVALCFFASQTAAVVCISIFIKRFPSSEDKLRIIPGLERKFSVPMDQTNPTIIL